MKKFNIKIKDLKFVFSSDTHRFLFNDFLKENEGKIIQVSKYVPIRTNQQNRYYWLYLGMIETETGNNTDDLHEYFKRKYLKPKFITVFGNEIKIPNTTSELNKSDFVEYLDKICAESGVALPDPNELEGYIPN
jgi:hypothetical protein